MFDKLFKRKRAPVRCSLVAQLNARLQPLHRGEIFEDPLGAELEKAGHGEVSGGGTMQAETGEIEYCDIEIQTRGSTADAVRVVIETLEGLGAPRGSKLHVEAESRELPFGVTEGMAVYLNGTELPANVHQESDSNFAHREFDRLLEGEGRVFSFWQGPTETAFYAYGKSFEQMRRRIAEFVDSYPLCQRCRIVQIA